MCDTAETLWVLEEARLTPPHVSQQRATPLPWARGVARAPQENGSLWIGAASGRLGGFPHAGLHRDVGSRGTAVGGKGIGVNGEGGREGGG